MMRNTLIEAFDFLLRIFCALFISNIINGQSFLRVILLAIGFLLPSIGRLFGFNSVGVLVATSGGFSVTFTYIFFGGPSTLLNLFWLVSSDEYISLNMNFCILFFCFLFFFIFLYKIKNKKSSG